RPDISSSEGALPRREDVQDRRSDRRGHARVDILASKNRGGNDRGSRQLLPPRVRLPLLITLVTLGVVGVSYYFYYLEHAEYFSGRNLRLLSMLTAQIEGRVDMYSGFVSTPNRATAELKTTVECKPGNS